MEVDGLVVTLSAVENWFGSEFIEFRVDDGSVFFYSSDVAEVTVLPINDPPILDPIGNQVTFENIPLEITLSASDVDNVDLIFSASSDNENIEATIRFDVLTLTPEDNWSGTANISVTVTDGFPESEDSETFQLEVISINEKHFL